MKWTSWAPVRNKPTVSVDVKQHFSNDIPGSLVFYCLSLKVLKLFAGLFTLISLLRPEFQRLKASKAVYLYIFKRRVCSHLVRLVNRVLVF